MWGTQRRAEYIQPSLLDADSKRTPLYPSPATARPVPFPKRNILKLASDQGYYSETEESLADAILDIDLLEGHSLHTMPRSPAFEEMHVNNRIKDPHSTGSIVPNYEGFEEHIRQLNPNMDSEHDWLVSRIARHQEGRYKSLLDIHVKHSHAVQSGKCASAKYCTGSDRVIDYFDVANSPTAESSSPFDNTISNDPQPESLYPSGHPLPPNDRYPALFECEICFQVKKFLKPSVSNWCSIFLVAYTSHPVITIVKLLCRGSMRSFVL